MNNIRLIGATALLAALAATGCATTTPEYGYGTPAPAPGSTSCYDCGTVTRVELASTGTSSAPNATGAVLGGIVGGVAGHELTKDSSQGKQNTATVAGAAAGAIAGHAIQKNAQAKAQSYTVYVRMDNGNNVTLNQADIGGISEGSYVRVYDGRVWAR
jgi:outer membrane lipoprotein SlyB